MNKENRGGEENINFSLLLFSPLGLQNPPIKVSHD